MAICRPADSIVRPTSLIRIHTIAMEGLNTDRTPQDHPESTNTAAAGANVGICFGHLES